jgi:predicted nucleotidyltransferase
VEIRQDFKEFIALLNKNEVEYLIVGGYAVAFHGAPRYTDDIDLLVSTSAENASRIMMVLKEFGFGSIGFTESDFRLPGQILQLGRTPVRIDLLTSIDGVEWEKAWAGRVQGEYGGLRVNFISKQDFIANKKSIGRNKDLADIDAIGAD